MLIRHDETDRIGRTTSPKLRILYHSVLRLQSSVTVAALVLCTVAIFSAYIMYNDEFHMQSILSKTGLPIWSRSNAISIDKYSINCPERCRRTDFSSTSSTSGQKDGDDRHVYLLIIVHSSLDHFTQRARIRRTWSNESVLTLRTWRRHSETDKTQTKSTFRIETVFVTGQADPSVVSEGQSTGNSDNTEGPEVSQQSGRRHKNLQSELEEEAKQNGDIIQGVFVDSYRNLTYKALTALHWTIDYCNNATFILKTDDDAFVNIFAVVQHLLDIEYYRQHTPSPGSNAQQYHHHSPTSDQPSVNAPQQMTPSVSNPGVIMCRVTKEPRVHRQGKWAVTEKEVPYNRTYPSFCGGIGYIMTPDVPRKLVKQAVALLSAHGPPFWIDDVYVTGILVRALNGSVRLFDMSKAFCRVSKMKVLYGYPKEWFKYVITHVSGLDDSGNRNSELFESTWKSLVRVATDGVSKTVIPIPKPIRPGRLADCYRRYSQILRKGVKARCIRHNDS